MSPDPQETVDLVTSTEEIPNAKLGQCPLCPMSPVIMTLPKISFRESC